MRYLALLLLLLAVGCGGQTSTNNTSEQSTQIEGPDTSEPCAEGTRRFKRPAEHLTDLKTREQLEEYIAHYWDDFDFDIGDRVSEYDEVDTYSAFAAYVMIIPQEQADSLLRHLIHRAERSREVLDFFSEMAHEVLNDPNSPTRNDEYYIPILETLLESELLDEFDKIVPQRDLKMARQNRIGTVANDFKYTLLSGATHTLHSIKADYTILLFNNPGCEMCATIIDEISTSEVIRELSTKHRITTLAVYPDEDLEAWRNYLPNMPDSWICAYDRGMAISQQESYDLKAIPSLYLLDRDKRVLIKDGASVAQLENVLLYATGYYN